MKIAIISDVHNNITNLKKVLDYCRKNKIKTLICCGDLASAETLDFLNDNFWNGSSTPTPKMGVELPNPTIYYTFGNMDNDQLKDHENIKALKQINTYKEFGELETDNKHIAFTHYPHKAKELCDTKKYDFVFHGHTHKPWTERIKNCTILNPGNVAGEIYPPTFAVWDTKDDNFELIRIHELK